MIRPALLALALLGARRLREEEADLPDPVPLTGEAVGHYCQMDLLEHPGPKAQAHLVGLPHPLFFSQVRDVVAYQRMPEQSHVVAVAYVSDMGAPGASWEDPGPRTGSPPRTRSMSSAARSRGMGAPELVPFARREAAEAFAPATAGRC
jgi:copper chaperone NosL